MEKQKNLKEIEKLIALNRPFLDREFKIKNIGIFGSFVRGEQGKGSDLDILVEFRDKIGLFKFLELEEFLEKLLNLKVDLVSRKALKPRIGQHILNEAIML